MGKCYWHSNLEMEKDMTNGGSKGPEEEKKEKPIQSPSTTEVGRFEKSRF
ncbi:hypothetical protein Pan241w_03920 [Gimesia alba]|uniref:Uncharacterized protein n=1 Tax=Gimesia alba TaxID=2527973 RepID=A0A517R8W1_9PLAN|nr:hypothetical protein Pan241w_03920 [Gimesia alba]